MEEYLSEFRTMYESYVKAYEKNPLTDINVDFGEWKLNSDRTGFANVYVKPVQKILHKPTFQQESQKI